MQIFTKDNNFLFLDKSSKTTKITNYYTYEKTNKFDPIVLFLYFQAVKKRTKKLDKIEFEAIKNEMYDIRFDINITNYEKSILIAKSVDFIHPYLSKVDVIKNDCLIEDFMNNSTYDVSDYLNAAKDYKMELLALKDDYIAYSQRMSSDIIYSHDENYLTYDEELNYLENIKYSDINIELKLANTLVRSNDNNFEFESRNRHHLSRFKPTLSEKESIINIDIEQANHFIYYQLDTVSDHVLKLYSGVIGGFATSRLFQEVREKNSLCYFIYSRPIGNDKMFIHCGMKSENIQKAEDIISELLKCEITKTELDEAKKQVISFYNKKRKDYFMNKKLVEDYLFENKEYEVDKIIEELNQVTIEEVNLLHQKIIKQNVITIK